MGKPWKESNADRTRKVCGFLRDAFSDYIAARVLLLSNLPQEAAILSSTAIEKCVKAMLAFRGNESRGHLKKAHWNALRNFDQDLASLIDGDFLELNRRAFCLRYTDALRDDFNLVVASREFLAEMDHTVQSIMSCFTVEQGTKPQKTPLETAIATKDNRLVAENHLLSGTPKQEFIYLQPQFIYEVRQDPLRGLMEIKYWTERPAKVEGFLREACAPSDKQRMAYSFSHFPVRPTNDRPQET